MLSMFLRNGSLYTLIHVQVALIISLDFQYIRTFSDHVFNEKFYAGPWSVIE